MKFFWVLYFVSLVVSLGVYAVMAHKHRSLAYWRTKYRLHPDGCIWAELILTAVVMIGLYALTGLWLVRHL